VDTGIGHKSYLIRVSPPLVMVPIEDVQPPSKEDVVSIGHRVVG
jgi:hypothetical protein